MTDFQPADLVQLLDWRRRVAELYAEIRSGPNQRAAWTLWSQERARLFREHPQSPVPPAERVGYTGPHVYDHDPAWRVLATAEGTERARFELPTSGPAPMAFTRFAIARFTVAGVQLSLDLYWLEGYAGGLFVPFADLTSGGETYGAGRYLVDSIKGADLGEQDGRLVLDFNYAYQPSCSYDPSWTCPLAPPANRLPVAVRAGERSEGEAPGRS
jgi:hypothetical protein